MEDKLLEDFIRDMEYCYPNMEKELIRATCEQAIREGIRDEVEGVDIEGTIDEVDLVGIKEGEKEGVDGITSCVETVRIIELLSFSTNSLAFISSIETEIAPGSQPILSTKHS